MHGTQPSQRPMRTRARAYVYDIFIEEEKALIQYRNIVSSAVAKTAVAAARATPLY